MREIDQTNYHELEFNFEGVVVGVPKVIGFDSELYFIKQKINYDTDERIYYMSGYNKEDETCNGVSHDGVPFSLNFIFRNWDEMKYYQFKNLEEFCTWYISQSNLNNFNFYNSGNEKKETATEKSIYKKIKEDKEWIHEKCGTNTPPTSIPEKPSVGNKKKDLNDKPITERMDDVFKIINKLPISESEKIGLYEQIRTREKHVDYILKLQDELVKDQMKSELHDINKEMAYWDLYNNPETDEKLKRLIEEEWPEFKNRPSQGYVRMIGEDGNPKWERLMSQDEIREKINPGWNTRRAQLKDVLKLLELRDRRQSTLETLLNAKEPALVEHLQNQLDKDEQRIEDFLNEKI